MLYYTTACIDKIYINIYTSIIFVFETSIIYYWVWLIKFFYVLTIFEIVILVMCILVFVITRIPFYLKYVIIIHSHSNSLTNNVLYYKKFNNWSSLKERNITTVMLFFLNKSQTFGILSKYNNYIKKLYITWNKTCPSVLFQFY